MKRLINQLLHSKLSAYLPTQCTLIFVFIIFCKVSFGQGFDANAYYAAEFTPPSPTAYELGKYGQIPVGTFTGTALYDIPLYAFQTNHLTVPISISYNSNGIKVDQMPTNVGLGWSLNAGGVITRIIRDEPDELTYLEAPEEEIDKHGVQSPIAAKYFYDINNQNVDSEIDLYAYNFNGISGKFVIAHNDNRIIQIPHNNLKITKHKDLNNEIYFEIITNDGVAYFFAETSTSKSRVVGSGHSPPDVSGTTAWHLSYIKHPYGDYVQFEYKASTGYTYTAGISQQAKIPATFNVTNCIHNPESYGIEVSPQTAHEVTINEKRLSSISSNIPEHGTIAFTYNSTGKFLESITIKNQNLTQRRKFNLVYLTTANDRVFLDEITFNNSSTNGIFKYDFSYDDPHNLVSRLSKSQDHWGYYNGKNNSHYYPNPLNLEFGHLAFQTYTGGGADKEPNHNYAVKGMLNKITYPSGGYTNIEYEGHCYNMQQEVSATPTNNAIVMNISSDDTDGGINTEEITLSNIHKDQKVPISGFVRFSPACEEQLNTGFHNKATVHVQNLTNPFQTNIINQFGIIPDFTNQYSGGFVMEENYVPNNLYMDLKAGNEYKVTLTIRTLCLEASCNFNYDSAMQPEQVEFESVAKPLGGMRVKRTIDVDLNGNADTTRYYYGAKESYNISSAEKGIQPLYWSNLTQRTICTGGSPLSCIYVDHEYLIVGSSSVRSNYNSISNQTTSYQYVTESKGGDNFEKGGIEHQYKISLDYPAKSIWGDEIQSAPWTNLGWGNGLEEKTTLFSKSNNSIKKKQEIINTYIEDDRYYDEVTGYVVRNKYTAQCYTNATYTCKQEDLAASSTHYYCDAAHTHTLSTLTPLNWCSGGWKRYGNLPWQTNWVSANNVTFVIDHPCKGKSEGEVILTNGIHQLDIMEYKTRSYWFYKNKETIKSYDDNGQNPVTKTTDYYYEDLEHLQPTKTTTTNSDNKIYETRYKYFDDYSNANIKTWLQNNNIIEPWHTTTYVYQNATDQSPKAVDGIRFYYNNFGTSDDDIVYYPKTFQRYECTWDANGNLQPGSWKTQRTFKSHDTTVGKPDTIQINGWSNPTIYRWTATGKLDSVIYKDFKTNYDYDPTTDLLSSITQPDGQISTFVYDNFQRLDYTYQRSNKIYTNYDYSYQPNYVSTQAYFYKQNNSTIEIIYNDKQTFDGLGRPDSLMRMAYAFDGTTDVISRNTYNNVGLTEKEIDPLNGEVKYTYYPDPLNRIDTIIDPMGFKSIKTYGTNEAGEVTGYDIANTLYKETITDPDGISNSTFTDKLGRVVMTMTKQGTEVSKTYTLYDDKGRVSKILPPGTTAANTNLIYSYTYDGADNVLSRKFPDKDKMEYNYDNRNLQTAMKDGNITANNKQWLKNEYDDYGRLTKQGFGSLNGAITELLIENFYDNNNTQNAVNQATPIYTGKLHKKEVSVLDGFSKGDNLITTNYVLDDYGRIEQENINNHLNKDETYSYTYNMADQVLTTTHLYDGNTTLATNEYDNKSRLTKTHYKVNGVEKQTAEITGYSLKDEVLSKVLGDNAQTVNYTYNANGWLNTINDGYTSGTASIPICCPPGQSCTTDPDPNNRVVANDDLFALDIKYNDPVHDNPRKNGNIAELHWQVNGKQKEYYNFTYDFLNRLKTATSLGDKYNTTYSYDARGNITNLQRNGLIANGTDCFTKQSIDNLGYTYYPGTNRLKHITDAVSTQVCPQNHHQSNTTNQSGSYGANITLSSDAQLSNSTNIEFTANETVELKTGFSTNGGLAINLNGCPTPNLVNNTLGALPASSSYGYKAYTGNTTFLYDANGNIETDYAKGLSIQYNHLNLPHLVTKDANNKIKWLYTAEGTKLQKETTIGGNSNTKDYLGDVELNNGKLQATNHSEGRYVDEGSQWEYNLKDHLGNVRIVFVEDNTGMLDIIQENHYYPFGMQMNGNWHKQQTVKNDYLYNGKELNTELGLNWSDYGFRFYDAAIGRFTGVDPISDQFPHVTTYNYAENEPIANIDLWGLQKFNTTQYDPNRAAMSDSDRKAFNKGQTEALKEVVNNVADEIPFVGEIKAFFEGGLVEVAAGLLPGGRKAKKIVNEITENAGDGNKVFRALRADEDPTKGLNSRSPGKDTEIGSHVMGKKESNLISTTKDEKKATGLFNSGNGVVEIDLNKVNGEVIDVSSGYGKGRVYSRTKSHQEVLIKDNGNGTPIPPEAIKLIEKPK